MSSAIEISPLPSRSADIQTPHDNLNSPYEIQARAANLLYEDAYAANLPIPQSPTDKGPAGAASADPHLEGQHSTADKTIQWNTETVSAIALAVAAGGAVIGMGVVGAPLAVVAAGAMAAGVVGGLAIEIVEHDHAIS